MTYASRDTRIDFARGLALLIMFSDHVQGNPVASATPLNFGFSDMAEIFVFLSGYVCGCSYVRRLREGGFARCQLKAILRSVELFVARVGVLLASAAVITTSMLCLPDVRDVAGVTRAIGSKCDIANLVLWASSFDNRPGIIDVLPLYIVFLLFLPAVIALLETAPLLAALAGGTSYLAVQLFPDEFGGFRIPWGFNPMAWQLLFYGGAAVAILRPRLRIGRQVEVCLFLMALVFIEYAALVKLDYPGFDLRWTEKRNLEPLRVIHCLAVVYLGRGILTKLAPVHRLTIAKPILICGRNALATYCSASVLAIIGTVLMDECAGGVWSRLAINLAGWFACVGLAYLWGELRGRCLNSASSC